METNNGQNILTLFFNGFLAIFNFLLLCPIIYALMKIKDHNNRNSRGTVIFTALILNKTTGNFIGGKSIQ